MFKWITFATTEILIAFVSSTLLQVLFVLAVMFLTLELHTLCTLLGVTCYIVTFWHRNVLSE